MPQVAESLRHLHNAWLIFRMANNICSSLPACSYIPGINNSSDLESMLPSFIYKSLQQAFKDFGKKMRGYFTNEAVVVATESRTSSPVRIPRNEKTLHHPQIENLYPCGEGAGYAGGIVSAAMDGERVAEAIIEKIKSAIQHKLRFVMIAEGESTYKA